MNITHVIKRKGAPLLSRICAMLEQICLSLGSRPSCDIDDSLLRVSVPAKAKHKRYTLAELMSGVTPKNVQALNAKTAWALEGVAVGEELI